MAEVQRQTPKITLKSCDDVNFIVDYDVIKKSATLKTIVDEIGIYNIIEPIPVPNVSSEILKKIIQYMEQYKNVDEVVNISDVDNFSVPAWNQAFLCVDDSTLFQLIIAANYLEIKGLMKSACMQVASILKDKTPDEIRSRFDIENDLIQPNATKIDGPSNDDHPNDDDLKYDDNEPKILEISDI